MQLVVDEIFIVPSRPRLAQNAPFVLPYAHYGLMGEVDAYQSVDWHMLFLFVRQVSQQAANVLEYCVCFHLALRIQLQSCTLTIPDPSVSWCTVGGYELMRDIYVATCSWLLLKVRIHRFKCMRKKDFSLKYRYYQVQKMGK